MCPPVMRARLRAVPGAGVRRSGAFVAPLPYSSLAAAATVSSGQAAGRP
jgi:hypothetical protein